MILNARRRLGPRQALLQALPPVCFYLLLAFLLVLVLPDRAWEIRPHHLVVVGLLGLWRYCWMLVHIVRSAVYQLSWFPRVRRQSDRLPPAEAYPERLYFLIPTFQEKPWITQQMLHALLREVGPLPCRTTLLISCAEGEETLFQQILRLHPRGNRVQVVLLNQRHGKRIGMGDALRSLCREHRKESSLVAFMDGDTVLGPDVLRKCLPLFGLFPRLGAVTTDELALVDGPRWYRQWYELRFSQRHRLMKSLALSRRVLTLTGRFSVFRTELTLDEEFIRYLEEDRLDHWLYGRFQFLTGDDKSTWFQLLKNGWEMLYVPDALVFCMEGAGREPLRQSVAKMHRWFGNMLRNNGRAIRLGPRPMGLFVWWCLVDQRLSMGTTLVGPVGALLLALFASPYYLPFYIFGAVLVRLFYLLVLSFEGHRMSFLHVPQLFYTQWMGALVKVWVLFRLDRQSWGEGRGGLSLKRGHGAPLFLRRTVPALQTALSALAFLGCVAVGVGVLRPPQWPGALLAATLPVQQSFMPESTVRGRTVEAIDFGARGDDGAPDSEAIQRALAALPPAGAGTVVLPAGRLLLDAPLRIERSQTWLVGAGSDATVLEASFARDRGDAALMVAGQGRLRGRRMRLAGPARSGERVVELVEPPLLEPDQFVWIGAANTEVFLAELGAEGWNRPYPWLRQTLAQVTAIRGRHLLLARPLSLDLPAGSRLEPVALVEGVRLRGFTLRHRPPQGRPEEVAFRYENLYPEHAVDGIALRWAAYGDVTDIRVEMAGRHPINLDSSLGIELRHLTIDGAWNKGEGGSGYVRFARSHRCLLRDSTIRNIRHLTFQWSAAENQVRDCTVEVDINFHGGFSHHNRVLGSRLEPPSQHPWPPVVRTPANARWAPPDGSGNEVIPGAETQRGG